MSADKARLTLSPADRQSPAWAHIREILEARIERHRMSNDAALSPEETAKLRGRIAELKDLLKLDREPAQAPE